MGNCEKIKKTIDENDFTYKCIKFYVYKIKPETLKFVVVVFCLVVCLFVFSFLFLLLIIIIIIIIISFEL